MPGMQNVPVPQGKFFRRPAILIPPLVCCKKLIK